MQQAGRNDRCSKYDESATVVSDMKTQQCTEELRSQSASQSTVVYLLWAKKQAMTNLPVTLAQIQV